MRFRRRISKSDTLSNKTFSGHISATSDANVYLSLDTTQTNGDEWQIFNVVSGVKSQLQFKNVDQTAYPLVLTEDGYAGFNNVAPTQAIDVTGNIIASGIVSG